VPRATHTYKLRGRTSTVATSSQIIWYHATDTMFFPQHPSGTSSSSGNQRVAPPSSRLSPPPGTSVEDLIASSDISGKGKKKKEDAPKRGYRACVHCRLRKARCDLGDVNSPSEPPCTRCRREQRNCVFLPSVSELSTCSSVADE
jgi:hypothetical protein